MEQIPMEWVDKLFNCMNQFYGERWSKQFSDLHTDSFYRVMWKNGLVGLNYDQIKAGLKRCQNYARDQSELPPHIMEFYRWAKDASPPIEYVVGEEKKGDPEIARKHLSDIKLKLR